MPQTRRQLIADLLRKGPITLPDLAHGVGAPVNLVRVDLEHVIRSLQGKGQRLIVEDAECLSCGFSFKGRTRVETPSRCPHCKSEQIREPRFSFESLSAGGPGDPQG
jgi:hypothetical protein